MLNRITYLGQEKAHFDLVHCFETRPATIYPALFFCNKHKIPLITDWNDWWGRGGLIEEVRPKWYRYLFGGIETYYEEAFRVGAAGTTVISLALAQRALRLGVSSEQICYIPGGTSLDSFQPRDKNVCRKHCGLQASIPILGFSSLDSHLDLEIVLQSLAIVAKRFPEVKLIITGATPKTVKELGVIYGVEGNLILTGFLPYEELSWYLGCADLFLLPFPDKVYNVGRWPNKICDYMSLGRPTITNAVGDIKILFEEHDIGLISRWDHVDFAEKIIYLLEHPQISKKLGDNARDLAVTEFDWKILIKKLEQFYYSILDKSKENIG